MLEKELRLYEPRSRFPKRPPFRAHFRAFYPHPAHKSALRAEVAAHFLAPGKRGWSPLATVLPSHAPRFPPMLRVPRRDQRGQVVRGPSPAGYCLTPTADSTKTERGPISASGPSISLCAEPGDSCAQINPFLPTHRRSPVDRSLVAGGAPRQRLEACLPDAHRPQCLLSRRSP